MKEPDVLTRMRLCECWGDSLNVEELKEVNDYIEELQQENQNLKERVAYLRIQVSAREKVANEYKETLDKAIKHVETLLNHNTGMNCGDMQDFLYFLRGDD